MLNNQYINWIDGMKINKSHFLHTDKVNTAYRSFGYNHLLASYEYGLGLYNGNMHQEIIVIEDNLLKVQNCHAISSGGVEFVVDKNDNVNMDISQLNSGVEASVNQKHYVILSADLDQYMEYGNPDPNEIPPRFPYRKPTYKLSTVSHKTDSMNYNSANALCIGCLITQNNRLVVDEAFIPCCSKVKNHQISLDQYMRVERILDEIHANAINVVQNAISKKKHGEINDLASNTFYLMEKIVFFLTDKMSLISTIYKEQSPIYMFALLNSFARTILAGLACIKSEDKEALLRYFESHLGFKPHQFESDLKALANLKYRHFELQQCYEELFKYLETVRTYVNKSIQLEYHSAERVDVINETVIKKRKLDIF